MRGNERCRNSTSPPCRSRNAPAKFGRCDRALTPCTLSRRLEQLSNAELYIVQRCSFGHCNISDQQATTGVFVRTAQVKIRSNSKCFFRRQRSNSDCAEDYRSKSVPLLTHSLIHHFETVPNSKKLQTTTEMWLLVDFKIQIA